ncbi:lecithin-cholesterol acyltransferase-like 1 [Senna tora]|uniref:Lecithin-cholesterol acyltransferase-like 1 n=1 Tax=Senna tora TaxID=362788 RepID=A0A834TXR5_9FABA|nr:lecithin-cholesterol acyltransferase-like 1 [Senna tora]
MKGFSLKIAACSIVVVLAIVCIRCGTSSNVHPLILIPGAGGSQLEARLTEHYKPTSPICDRWYPLNKDHDGWYRTWFDPSLILAPFTDCFAQRMMLHFDPLLDDYYNTPGVQTRVPHFGNTLGIPLVEPLRVRAEQRSFESNLWLLPNPMLFGSAKPLVITKNRNYTASDISDFLKDIGFPEGDFPYETRIVPLMRKIEAPGVGAGVRTSESLIYWDSEFDKQPEVSYGDGDGAVSMVHVKTGRASRSEPLHCNNGIIHRSPQPAGHLLAGISCIEFLVAVF